MFKNKKSPKITSTLIILLILITTIIATLRLSSPKEIHAPIINEAQLQENKIKTITYTAEIADQNAFELLKENAEIEYKEYDFGVFVESINGVKGNNQYFWAFYLNNEQALTGADQTILEKNDKVEWRYEEIKY